MKRRNLFLFPLLALGVTVGGLLFGSCRNQTEAPINSLSSRGDSLGEKQKIERMEKLHKEYGWEIEIPAPWTQEKYDRYLLSLDYDSTKKVFDSVRARSVLSSLLTSEARSAPPSRIRDYVGELYPLGVVNSNQREYTFHLRGNNNHVEYDYAEVLLRYDYRDIKRSTIEVLSSYCGGVFDWQMVRGMARFYRWDGFRALFRIVITGRMYMLNGIASSSFPGYLVAYIKGSGGGDYWSGAIQDFYPGFPPANWWQ